VTSLLHLRTAKTEERDVIGWIGVAKVCAEGFQQAGNDSCCSPSLAQSRADASEAELLASLLATGLEQAVGVDKNGVALTKTHCVPPVCPFIEQPDRWSGRGVLANVAAGLDEEGRVARAHPSQRVLRLVPLTDHESGILPAPREPTEQTVDVRHDLGQRRDVLTSRPQAGLDVRGHQTRRHTLARDVSDDQPPTTASPRNDVPVVATHLEAGPHDRLQFQARDLCAIPGLQRTLDLGARGLLSRRGGGRL
jgi:hypothetical protein